MAGDRSADGSWRARLATTVALVPPGAWFFLLLAIPLAILLVFSVGERAPAGGYAGGFTFDNYVRIPTRFPAFFNTLWMATLGTTLTAVIAYPLAYYLATRAGPKKTLLLVLVILPFWTSALIRTYAWMTILGNTGIPAMLRPLGIDVVLLNSPLAISVGIVYNYLPLMVFPLFVSLERLATFRQVTLPLSLPGILAGVVLVFIPVMGEYLIPALLGGGKVNFIGNALFDAFLQSRNWPLGSAMSIGLILVVLVAVSVYFWLGSRLGSSREVSLL